MIHIISLSVVPIYTKSSKAQDREGEKALGSVGAVNWWISGVALWIVGPVKGNGNPYLLVIAY